jgi:hypothetical protein
MPERSAAMSFQACTWALAQTISCSAKFTLVALAHHAGERGECYPTRKRLAQETAQSIPTIQRRLRELAREGLIYRAGQRRSLDRERKGEYGEGLTILLVDETAIAFARSLGFRPEDAARQNAEPSQNADPSIDESDEIGVAEEGIEEDSEIDGGSLLIHGRRITADPPYAPEDHGRSTDGGSPVIHGRRITADPQNNHLESLSPKSPFSKKTSSDPKLPDGWESDWLEFEKLWPWAEGALHEPVRRRFAKLPAADRLLAIRGVPNFLSLQRKQNRKGADARTYLRDKGWEIVGSASSPPKPVWIAKGTLAWNAWLAVKGRRGGDGQLTMIAIYSSQHKTEGWYFPTAFPPAASDHAHPPPAATEFG